MGTTAIFRENGDSGPYFPRVPKISDLDNPELISLKIRSPLKYLDPATTPSQTIISTKA